MAISVIVRLTLREAARRKVLWGLVILTLLFLSLYALALSFFYGQITRFGGVPRGLRGFDIEALYNVWMMMALYAANFLIVMMAVLISVDTVAGEIASGTIQSLAVKPLWRFEVLIGKWLGFAMMLGAYVLVLVGGVAAVTRLITGYAPPNLPGGFGLIYLEALVLLSVSILGGTRLSTLANGVLGFGAFGVAFIGGWIEQIGSLPVVGSEAAVTIGHVASLMMPSETLWRLASSLMGESGGVLSTPFSGFTTPDVGAVPYALAYVAMALFLAVASFQRRDL